MNGGICTREAELLDAIGDGTWPAAASRELHDHVAGCAACAELALVAGAIDAERREGERHASPPPSGAVWWRMQMRMEREAREAAARTARRAHSLVVGATVGAIATLLALTRLAASAWEWLAGAFPSLPALSAIHLPVPSLTMLALAGAATLMITPVALWLAFADE